MKCEKLLSLLPCTFREILETLKVEPEELQEIRVRIGRPVLALCGNREYRSEKIIDRMQADELLACLSNYSLYAYRDEIRQGFLSLPGGHRAGLAGRVVLEGNRVKTMTDISSVNIRLAHEIKGCADRLLPCLWEGDRLCHTLIVSAPGHGKTTLLRDCIRQISDGNRIHGGMTVGVVDERSEIAGSCQGIPGNDVGMRTDVLDGCPKAEGMMLLIRSMAPKVVAVDEIGSHEDVEALAFAMNCGCVLIATVHGNHMEELRSRPALQRMVEMRLFERYVFLDGMREPGQIRQVLGPDGQMIGAGAE